MRRRGSPSVDVMQESIRPLTVVADDEWSLDVDVLPKASGKLLVLCVNNCTDMRKPFIAVVQEHGLPLSHEIF